MATLILCQRREFTRVARQLSLTCHVCDTKKANYPSNRLITVI